MTKRAFCGIIYTTKGKAQAPKQRGETIMYIFAHNVNFYKENVIGLRSKKHPREVMNYEEMIQYMTDWANIQLNYTFSLPLWVDENYDAYTLAGAPFTQIAQEYAECHLEMGGELETLWDEAERDNWEPIEEEY